jgi:hypothetical protein
LEPYPDTIPKQIQVMQAAQQQIYDAGARGQMSTYHWADLEPNQSGYNADKFNELEQALAYAQSKGLTQFIGIQMINTNVLEMPGDLATLPFDTAVVKRRFHALLDKIIKPHVGRIRYLSLGNEVDVYLRANPVAWPQYLNFYQDAVSYAKSLDPSLLVGVTATASGAIVESRSNVQALNAFSDVVILTYYPLDFNSGARVTVHDPAVVASDFKQMLDVAGGKPLVLQEVGYPASAVIGGSEDKQSAFVTQVFAAWQDAGGRIPFLTYFLLHDIPSSWCDAFVVKYGATALPGFKEYLCTLGLIQVDGTQRPAWPTLINEAKLAHLP